MKSISSAIVAVAGSIILYSSGVSPRYTDFQLSLGTVVVMVGIAGVFLSKDK